jgi:hypothetical protein
LSRSHFPNYEAPYGNHSNYGNYADYADVINPPAPHPIASQPELETMNPYGTLASVASHHHPSPSHQPTLNHYGTLSSISSNHQSPNRQMNHYGTLTSITSSTIANLNNNRLPPTSHSSPYSQYNGSKEDYSPAVATLPRGNVTPTLSNYAVMSSAVVPDSPSSNQSGGPLLRQSLSQYPQSSPEGSGCYPLYGGEALNRSSGTLFFLKI